MATGISAVPDGLGPFWPVLPRTGSWATFSPSLRDSNFPAHKLCAASCFTHHSGFQIGVQAKDAA